MTATSLAILSTVAWIYFGYWGGVRYERRRVLVILDDKELGLPKDDACCKAALRDVVRDVIGGKMPVGPGLSADNFDHGDIVVVTGGGKARVWKPRWWQVWRHAAWLVFCWQQRTSRVTLCGGGVLKLVSVPAGDRSA